jgi:RHS repeat-associated protein
MNKVMSISENGNVSATYDYHVDGQVAKRLGADGKAQNFFWDGLALIRRGETNLTNEPYVTGGNPIIANSTALFNDILGTTQGYVSSGEASTNAPSRTGDGKDFAAISRDSFGQTLDNSTDTNYDYFTGKPKVEGLGYAFLFRNYAAGLGKWTTSDPLGYPDGWNNFAYVNNLVIGCIDRFGTDIYHVVDTDSSWHGHSATIIGNPTDGYKAYNFGGAGGGYTMGNKTDTVYSTPHEALAALNSGRTGAYEYDKVQKWSASRAQDLLAQNANKAHIDADGYTWYGNNCIDAVMAALAAAAVNYTSFGVICFDIYENNRLWGYAQPLDYGKFKSGQIE